MMSSTDERNRSAVAVAEDDLKNSVGVFRFRRVSPKGKQQ